MDRVLNLPEKDEVVPPGPPPTPAQQLRAWVTIGTQSVGGGPSTLYVIRSILVGRRRWLTMQEFVQDWTLSRLSIGNHLTALAALLGHRVGGRRGIVLAVAGMLIPAGIIMAAVTGGYALIRDQPAIEAALQGVAPVTIGMMFAISAWMLRTILGPRSQTRLLDVGVFVAALTAGFLVAGSTMLIIIAGAAFGTLFLGRDEVPAETDEG